MNQRIKHILLIPIVLSTLFLQSCIELAEEVIVNDDQSGKIVLSVGAGGQNPLFALISKYADMSFMDEIRINAQQVAAILKGQEGISDVRLMENAWNNGFELSFNFENDRVLNDALYATAGVHKTFLNPDIYKIRDHKFVRKNTTGWIQKLIRKEKEHLPDEAIFDLVVVKSVYRLPRPANRVKASCDLTSTDQGRTFSTTNYLSDLLDKRINTKVKIRY